MNKLFFVLLLLFNTVLTGSLAFAEESKDLAALNMAHNGYLNSMQALNSEKTAEFVGSQFLWVNNKVIWPSHFDSKDTIRGMYKKLLDRNGTFSVRSVQPSYLISGNTGIVSGLYYFRANMERDGRKKKGGGYNRFVEVWVKEEGEWKLTSQSTVYSPGLAGGQL